MIDGLEYFSTLNSVQLTSLSKVEGLRVSSITVRYGEVTALHTTQESFNGKYDLGWKHLGEWFLQKNSVEAGSVGRLFYRTGLNQSTYDVMARFDKALNKNLQYGLVFGRDSQFWYSLRVKQGPWGGLYVYRHKSQNSWDISGELVASKPVPLTRIEQFDLNVSIRSNMVVVELDDEASWEFDLDTKLILDDIGVISLNGSSINLESFAYTYQG